MTIPALISDNRPAGNITHPLDTPLGQILSELLSISNSDVLSQISNSDLSLPLREVAYFTLTGLSLETALHQGFETYNVSSLLRHPAARHTPALRYLCRTADSLESHHGSSFHVLAPSEQNPAMAFLIACELRETRENTAELSGLLQFLPLSDAEQAFLHEQTISLIEHLGNGRDSRVFTRVANISIDGSTFTVPERAVAIFTRDAIDQGFAMFRTPNRPIANIHDGGCALETLSAPTNDVNLQCSEWIDPETSVHLCLVVQGADLRIPLISIERFNVLDNGAILHLADSRTMTIAFSSNPKQMAA